MTQVPPTNPLHNNEIEEISHSAKPTVWKLKEVQTKHIYKAPSSLNQTTFQDPLGSDYICPQQPKILRSTRED